MAFIPRLEKPASGNPYYNTPEKGGYAVGIINGSPVDPGCNVLANCVGYAAGRFNEILGANKFLYFQYAPNPDQWLGVAKLAGLPDSIIERAKEILAELNQNAPREYAEPSQPQEDSMQLSLMPSSDGMIEKKLRAVDVNILTPIEAMNILYGASTYERFDAKPSRLAERRGGSWVEQHNTALITDASGRADYYNKSKLVVGVEATPYPAVFVRSAFAEHLLEQVFVRDVVEKRIVRLAEILPGRYQFSVSNAVVAGLVGLKEVLVAIPDFMLGEGVSFV